MSDELKACPFCTSSAQIDEVEMAIYAACCDRCGCMGPIADSPSEAIESWNHRPVAEDE